MPDQLGSISVSWLSGGAGIPSPGSPITQYLCSLSLISDPSTISTTTFNVSVDPACDNTGCVSASLTVGRNQAYQLQVKAGNLAGWGEYSEMVSVNSSGGVSEPVSRLETGVVGSGNVEVVWDDLANSHTDGAAPTAYVISQTGLSLVTTPNMLCPYASGRV